MMVVAVVETVSAKGLVKMCVVDMHQRNRAPVVATHGADS